MTARVRELRNRLVVGFDGSPNSIAAVQWAAIEAEVRAAAVRVIGSYAPVPVVDQYGISAVEAAVAETEEHRQDCLTALEGIVAEVGHRHPAVGFDLVASDLLAARAIVSAGEEADLVVVGSSGTGPVRAALLGSVMSEVLHESACPVVVVPARVPEHIGRIVVGIDGSECSERAVVWAADEAQRHRAELVVLHAWKYPYRLTEAAYTRGCDIVHVDAALVLEQAVAAARELTSAAITGTLLEGGAAQCLLDASEDADLLVVGSRGRGGFRAMVFGSVALAVVGHSICPTVVTH